MTTAIEAPPPQPIRMYRYGPHCMRVGEWTLLLGVQFDEMFDEIVRRNGDVSAAIGYFIQELAEELPENDPDAGETSEG